MQYMLIKAHVGEAALHQNLHPSHWDIVHDYFPYSTMKKKAGTRSPKVLTPAKSTRADVKHAACHTGNTQTHLRSCYPHRGRVKIAFIQATLSQNRRDMLSRNPIV